MNAANDTVDRTNVTSAQQAPNRVEADSLWYARLGYGGVAGPSFGPLRLRVLTFASRDAAAHPWVAPSGDGKIRMNVVPSPTRLRTSMEPPCSSTTR